ncbi:MAG TPA: serine/threonine-protein kinase, partial [Polyangiaceae bacterium]|nr:serine/threonine-protein kinase [Polyangiaceae bacterium]
MYERNLANITLGRYQLLVAIARGGMGQVWLGRLHGARGFNKVVAVKTLLPDEGDRARLEGMLAEEARLSSLIQHANVVRTLELGEHDGLLYLVMEWVDGEPLAFLQARAAERGGMPIGVAVALISQVLAGLHAAHELSDDSGPLGVVHRDVSPHNILVTYEGIAKLLDFGIAKATKQASPLTDGGELKGKFSFMAPEQILGAQLDRRSDVFAAGIVLYLLTTGQHPFEHASTAGLIHAIAAGGSATAPSRVVTDFPAELERVLLKALEKDADKRWRSAEEMRVALEQALPAAFGDGGRSALREFMERTVGDRKVARREAVRRAQLAANYRDAENRTARLQTSADSVASLRAISISQTSQPDGADSIPTERPPVSQRARPPKRRARAPWVAATAGVALALAALLPRVLPSHDAGQSSAAAAPLEGTPLITEPPAPMPSSVPSVAPAPSA